jgi:hypothetical protein
MKQLIAVPNIMCSNIFVSSFMYVDFAILCKFVSLSSFVVTARLQCRGAVTASCYYFINNLVCVPEHHAMNTKVWSGRKAPHMLNFYTSLRRAASVLTPALHPVQNMQGTRISVFIVLL